MRNKYNAPAKLRNAANLAFAVLLLVVLGCSCPKLKELVDRGSDAPASSKPASPSSTPPTPSDDNAGEYHVTLDKYNQINVGMPRADVERILGGKGTEISNTAGGGKKFSVNKWEGEQFKAIILTFRNDKVMTKLQVGLE